MMDVIVSFQCWAEGEDCCGSPAHLLQDFIFKLVFCKSKVLNYMFCPIGANFLGVGPS